MAWESQAVGRKAKGLFASVSSGLFRDMLSDSVSSISLDNPLPIDEDSKDFEILLLIVVGRGEEAAKRVTTWNHAEKLYRRGEKYQIDGPRPWFSRLCTQCAFEKPWDALFLACNVSPMDTDIIRQAISIGFPDRGVSTIGETRYFKKIQSTDGGSTCWSTIRPTNFTTLLGLRLGLLGLLAYGHTFADNKTAAASSPAVNSSNVWQGLAQSFVLNVKAVEKVRDAVSHENQTSHHVACKEC
jgi:hypothetical protein